MNAKQHFVALMAAAGLATAGGMAWSQPAPGSTAAPPTPAAHPQGRISLQQAIAAAEKHHPGGTATKAELDTEWGQAVYEVEVRMPDRQEYDVKIDASNGKVLSSRLDR
jgi:uncharacterized membrane protein YkoI